MKIKLFLDFYMEMKKFMEKMCACKFFTNKFKFKKKENKKIDKRNRFREKYDNNWGYVKYFEEGH